MDKGPHREILGELQKAINDRGMKLITTFHHARNLQRYKGKEMEELEKNKETREGHLITVIIHCFPEPRQPLTIRS